MQTQNAQDRIARNAAEIKRLRQEIKAKARERELEIMFLRQAITAKAIRQDISDNPSGQWEVMVHNHLCPHCDETWRCECDDHTYEVKDHGCPEQAAHMRKVIAVLNRPSPWDEPYLSRYVHKPRKSSEERMAEKIIANEAEIARLRAELGKRA